jgi:hypothetical protein
MCAARYHFVKRIQPYTAAETVISGGSDNEAWRPVLFVIIAWAVCVAGKETSSRALFFSQLFTIVVAL